MFFKFKSYFIRNLFFIKNSVYKIKLTHQYRNLIIKKLKNTPTVLSDKERTDIKIFYGQFGFSNVKTYWHEFYSSSNNFHSVKYVPEDLFHAVISNRFNQMRQWPALLDKNILDLLFKDFRQPETIIKNVNGFYFDNGKIVSEAMAVAKVNEQKEKMVIKPSIDSGLGVGVVPFETEPECVDYCANVKELLRSYGKDFIVQKVIEQHNSIKILNPSSLNTVRVFSYLNDNGVHVLSVILRIGKKGNFTDNCATGGIACGVGRDGKLKQKGYLNDGTVREMTDSKIILNKVQISCYKEIISMVKRMHLLVSYFRFVSWDIGIDSSNSPVLIEYNTYHQDITIHQLANGPLFGEFTEEILEYNGN